MEGFDHTALYFNWERHVVEASHSVFAYHLAQHIHEILQLTLAP